MHYICLHDVYYNIHHTKYTTCNSNFKQTIGICTNRPPKKILPFNNATNGNSMTSYTVLAPGLPPFCCQKCLNVCAID